MLNKCPPIKNKQKSCLLLFLRNIAITYVVFGAYHAGLQTDKKILSVSNVQLLHSNEHGHSMDIHKLFTAVVFVTLCIKSAGFPVESCCWQRARTPCNRHADGQPARRRRPRAVHAHVWYRVMWIPQNTIALHITRYLALPPIAG